MSSWRKHGSYGYVHSRYALLEQGSICAAEKEGGLREGFVVVAGGSQEVEAVNLAVVVQLIARVVHASARREAH